MRKYSVTFDMRTGTPVKGTHLRTLWDCGQVLNPQELDAVASLAVGETFVDEDGDTWERVE